MDLFLNFLHLFALALLVRLFIPVRATFFNPYAAVFDRGILHLLRFFQPALPLSERGIYAFLFVLTLLSRAALLATQQQSQFLLAGPFLLATFPTESTLDWFIIQGIDFAFFYFTLLSATFLLRLWHFLKPMPGNVAELLLISGYPFTRLKIRYQGLFLVFVGALLFLGVDAFALRLEYPFQALEFPTSMPKEQVLQMQQFVNLSSLPAGIWHFTFSLLTIIGALLPIVDAYLMLFWIFLLTLLFRSKVLQFFLFEALELLRGRFPKITIGFLNVTALLLFFILFPLLYGLFSTFIILLIKVIVYVV